MKLTLSILGLLTGILLITCNGCASGSAVLTGTARPALEPTTVKLYTSPPAKYEVIALVKSSSDAGWTAQGSQDYAVEELKKQAAKLGANGVLIRSNGEHSTSAFMSGGSGIFYSTPASSQDMAGEAIFVSAEK